ncbi:MAG: bifunctional phosphopantothenoylcysteine decarboxylase/phosphopantothenate--cysteine ligase CoaBC [Bacteroidota bacterium]
MSKFRILVKITGSIAAYKSAQIISKLVQNNCEVKTVITPSALQFIGKATLEGLTNNIVYSDVFELSEMMSHIDLNKWADLIIVIPATGNTINKFAAGIADNLLTSLFLSRDESKPYLIAPAMNTNMYNHPATQESLKTLEKWGVKILPTDEGYLACGDTGRGKLLNLDKIFGYIFNELNRVNRKKFSVLVTGGATIESIDNTRYVSNLSTGRTACTIADGFYLNGANVTLIKSKTAVSPKFDFSIKEFDSFLSLRTILESEIKKNHYDLVIHSAAISDYSPISIEHEGSKLQLPLISKTSFSTDQIKITFKKNEKLVNNIKEWFENNHIILIAFKFLNSYQDKRKEDELRKIFRMSKADGIVFNSFDNRKKGKQYNFELISLDGLKSRCETVEDLSNALINKWMKQ